MYLKMQENKTIRAFYGSSKPIALDILSTMEPQAAKEKNARYYGIMLLLYVG
jgi:hypothetical protein